jgi:mevalonate kinase
MYSKVDELFELSEEKLNNAKRLMEEMSKIDDAGEKEKLEERIKELLDESNQLSKIAEKLGVSDR